MLLLAAPSIDIRLIDLPHRWGQFSPITDLEFSSLALLVLSQYKNVRLDFIQKKTATLILYFDTKVI